MICNVGERIKNRRKVLDLSQDELAELASLNRVTVAKYESGKVEPGAQALSRIADALETSVDALLGRDIVNTDDWDPEQMNYADRENESIRIMARGMSRMSEENRQKLLDVARVMFKEDFDEEGNKRS